jgi:hypothetical protein
MDSNKLINLINGDKKILRDWALDFDKKSNSINDWQTLLGYPLETYSCQICHKIRNNILNGIHCQFGTNHLKLEAKGIARSHFEDAIRYITEGEQIKNELKPLYSRISKLLYNN